MAAAGRLAPADAFQYWGPYLAQRGYALFAISYRLAKQGKKMFPQAVNDVRAAVQFVRASAGQFRIDPERIGLFGGNSAGAHLASLAALARRQPGVQGRLSEGPACLGQHQGEGAGRRLRRLRRLAQCGSAICCKPAREQYRRISWAPSPTDDPRLYFDASPINYATFANNQMGVFLAVGTEDDLVDRSKQNDVFLLRLKQANFSVRPCIVQGAPHYWLSDPIDEPGSYSGFMAPRLMRFLKERL